MELERAGPYDVVAPLGRGGMGVVSRARHRESGVEVALKTVRLPRAELLESIRREIHTLARLDHPGIVRIVDEGVEAGLPWYAMELLEGATLRTALTGGADDGSWWTRALPGRAPEPAREPPRVRAGVDEVLRLVRAICDPLAYLHGEGLVHRDLKPDNVLVRADGSVALIDFGLAAAFSGSESREVLVSDGSSGGTLAFMAPEQLRGESVDARADVWALGCILSWGLTGKAPWDGAGVEAILDPSVMMHPLPAGLGARREALEALLSRLLARSVHGRAGYAEIVARELEALGALPPAHAVPRPKAHLYRPRVSGRGSLLDALATHARSSLKRGSGDLLLVAGESGIGKTRFVTELASRLRGDGVVAVAGECRVSGGAFLEPLQPLMRQVADRALERAGGGAEEVPLLDPEQVAVLAPHDAALRRIAPATEAPPASPEESRRRVFLALRGCLEVLAGGAGGAGAGRTRAAVVLLLDDLQWADDLTLGFLGHLADEGLGSGAWPGPPLLLVGTFRADETGPQLQALRERAGIHEVRLGRLEPEAVSRMCADMLALAAAPPALADWVLREGEGVPFFVAEYLRAAVEEGILRLDPEGRWLLVRGALDGSSVLLPRSLSRLVAHRLGALPPAAARALAVAAVLGRETTFGLVEAAGEIQGDALREAVAELLRRAILEESSGGRLRFAHDKLREGAEARIDPAEAPAIHGRAADALAALPEAERPLHEIARHLDAAGDVPRAREAYLAAGRAARLRYAHAEAERSMRRYLELFPEPTKDSVRWRYWYAWDVLHIQGRGDEALRELDLALADARRIGDASGEAMSLLYACFVLQVKGEMAEALARGERALAIAELHGPRRVESFTLGCLASVHQVQGRLSRAHDLFARALAIAEEGKDVVYAGRLVANIATVLREQGRMEEADTQYARGIAMSRGVEDDENVADALGNLAHMRCVQGRLAEADALFEESLALKRRVGLLRTEGHSLGELSGLRLLQGRLAEARELCDRATEISRRCGDASEAPAKVLRARLARYCGEHEAALALLDDAEPELRRIDHRISLVLALCERGLALLGTGRSAEPQLAQAREAAEVLDATAGSEVGRALSELERAVARAPGPPAPEATPGVSSGV